MEQKKKNCVYNPKGSIDNGTIIFIVCWILILVFSLYIIHMATKFYNNLDTTMKNSTNLNIEEIDSSLDSNTEISANELIENSVVNSDVEISNTQTENTENIDEILNAL